METPFSQIHMSYNSIEEALSRQEILVTEFNKQALRIGLKFHSISTEITNNKNVFINTLTYYGINEGTTNISRF